MEFTRWDSAPMLFNIYIDSLSDILNNSTIEVLLVEFVSMICRLPICIINLSSAGLQQCDDYCRKHSITFKGNMVTLQQLSQQTFSDKMPSNMRHCPNCNGTDTTSVSSRFRIGDTGGILTMPPFVTDDAYSSPLRHVHVTIVKRVRNVHCFLNYKVPLYYINKYYIMRFEVVCLSVLGFCLT